MFPINVSLFAQLGKHCCGNKIYFPESKNVSQQIQKNFCCGNNVSQFAHIFSNVSSTKNIVFPIRQTNINNTVRFVRASVSKKMFPRQETMFLLQCFLVCPGLKLISRVIQEV